MERPAPEKGNAAVVYEAVTMFERATPPSEWTRQQEQLLPQLFAEGLTYPAISIRVDKSEQAVRSKLHRMGLFRNRDKRWTPERDEILTTMHSAGDSFSIIADEIGGITRNAAIGRAHRLGLPRRVLGLNAQVRVRHIKPRPERKTRFHAPKQNSPPTALTAPRPRISLPPEPLPEPIPCPIEPLRIPFMEIAHGQCRDIIGHDGPDGLAVFCGHPTVEGTSYCPFHCSIFYRRPGVAA